MTEKGKTNMTNVPIILLSIDFADCTTTYYKMRENDYFEVNIPHDPNCDTDVFEIEFNGIISEMTDAGFDPDEVNFDISYTIQFIDHDFKDILITRLLNPSFYDDADGFRYACNRIVDYITKE